jgi:hypothetical protein
VTRLTTAANVLSAASLALTPLAPALAEDAADDRMQQETQMQQAQYTDDQLERFLEAAIEVQVLTQDYTPRVEAAESEAGQKALLDEANAQIRGAVEDVEGLTIEEYVAIGQAAQSDPALAQRITAMAEQLAQEPPEG